MVGKVERTKIRIIILLFLLVYEGHLDVVVNIKCELGIQLPIYQFVDTWFMMDVVDCTTVTVEQQFSSLVVELS